MWNKFLKKSAIIFVCVQGLTACMQGGPHNPAETAVKAKDVATGGDSAQISYESVKPIFEARCKSCHGPANGDLNWLDEAKAKKAALRGVISTRLGNKTMPQPNSPEASAITNDERATLIAWAKSQSAGIGAGGGASGVPSVDMIQNRKLAFVNRCAACHGLNGMSLNDNYPNLASDSKDFLLTRLSGFLAPEATGLMPSSVRAILTDFSIEVRHENDGALKLTGDGNELLQYATDWFSHQSVSGGVEEVAVARATLTAEDQDAYKLGAKIFADNSCVSCHLSNDLRPLAPQPMIFLQKRTLLARRFTEFGQRQWGQIMPDIVSGLKEEERKALTVYLSNTHPAELTQLKSF